MERVNFNKTSNIVANTALIELSNLEASYLYFKIFNDTGKEITYFDPGWEHYFYFGTVISVYRDGQAILNLSTYGECTKGFQLMAVIVDWMYKQFENDICRFFMFGTGYMPNKYLRFIKHIGGMHWYDRNGIGCYALDFPHVKAHIDRLRERGKLLPVEYNDTIIYINRNENFDYLLSMLGVKDETIPNTQNS